MPEQTDDSKTAAIAAIEDQREFGPTGDSVKDVAREEVRAQLVDWGFDAKAHCEMWVHLFGNYCQSVEFGLDFDRSTGDTEYTSLRRLEKIVPLKAGLITPEIAQKMGEAMKYGSHQDVLEGELIDELMRVGAEAALKALEASKASAEVKEIIPIHVVKEVK